jgi:branched-chain amino acid transport system substrate-binding protein
MSALIGHVRRNGAERFALILPNSAWGHSCERAVLADVARHGGPVLVATRWYNRGETAFSPYIVAARGAGAEALVAAVDEVEGAAVVRDLAALPPAKRLPVASHWGLAGGDFPALAGPALRQVDLVMVQTFGFADARGPAAARVASAARRLFGDRDLARFTSAGGLAHAYDLVHILARAVDGAGTTDRAEVRRALERVIDYRGLVRHFARPFTPARHEALGGGDAYLARFDERGVLVRARAR